MLGARPNGCESLRYMSIGIDNLLSELKHGSTSSVVRGAVVNLAEDGTCLDFLLTTG